MIAYSSKKVDWQDKRVLDVVGSVMYNCDRWCHIDNRGIGFEGKNWQGANTSVGLVLVLGTMTMAALVSQLPNLEMDESNDTIDEEILDYDQIDFDIVIYKF